MVSHNQGTLTWGDGYVSLQGPAGQSGTLVVDAPRGGWNVSGYNRMTLKMAATQGKELKLKVMARNPHATDWKNAATSYMYLTQGEHAARPFYIYHKASDLNHLPPLQVFKGMRALPGGFWTFWRQFDPANVVKITIRILPKEYAQKLRLYSIHAAWPVVPTKLRELGSRFFPFIDLYGQYRYRTWPGKITSDEQLKQSFQAEKKDLAAHPAPANHDKWGGWKTGPQVDATGFFRTTKRHGKWWLVDPDGHLFWSAGVCCVGLWGGATSTVGRENYFTYPSKSSDAAQFFTGKDIDFLAANLYRALGPDWKQKYLNLTQRRLASWGLNTIGNWSSIELMKQDQTPYTVPVRHKSAMIRKKLPDPFAADFRPNLRKALEKFAFSAKDPWCIGYFVDNELHWGWPMEISRDVLQDPADTAAKKVFVAQLRQKFHSIRVLDKKLGTSFKNWDALQRNTKTLNVHPIMHECYAFYRSLCDKYFSTCREEVKRFAPHHLYLGCRFMAGKYDPILLQICAKYADVISYNLYGWSIANTHWKGVDKPFIGSEFHFGSQTRGMWGVGLSWASSQEGRADLYRDYVEGALRNPDCVGTHWFEYNSEPFTGRGDGEDYEIGLSDVAGRPWPKLRHALREVGQQMYQIRHDASGGHHAAPR